MPLVNYEHKCFTAAYDAACAQGRKSPVISHGWINLGQLWIFHAWCEVGNFVYDYTEFGKTPVLKTEYYLKNRVSTEVIQKYTFKEISVLMVKYGNYGPFDRIFIRMGKVLYDNPKTCYELHR